MITSCLAYMSGQKIVEQTRSHVQMAVTDQIRSKEDANAGRGRVHRAAAAWGDPALGPDRRQDGDRHQHWLRLQALHIIFFLPH